MLQPECMLPFDGSSHRLTSEDTQPIAADELRWYAVQVKPRSEKVVSAALRLKGYTEFVPLYASQRSWSDRIKTVHLPLFPGYVFLQLDIRHRLPVLKTPGVVSFVSLGAEPSPIETREVDDIRSLVRAGLPLGPWPYLREGQAVEVERGALRGLRGLLLKIKNEYRLVVSVHLLQRSVAVEVDRDAIRPLL